MSDEKKPIPAPQLVIPYAKDPRSCVFCGGPHSEFNVRVTIDRAKRWEEGRSFDMCPVKLCDLLLSIGFVERESPA